jgi:4-nitrophenyl phosphatase
MNLGAVTTLIFDLDGVVWRGNAPIESAVEAISQFQTAGKRCLYCTNNSSKTPTAYVEKLKGLGIEASEDDIITSSTATALYLSAQYTGPFLAYVVGEEGIQTAIQKIGARIVYDRDIDQDTKVDCVVAGIDHAFNYEKLNTAQRLIRNGALFVATNRDTTYPVEEGVIPGAGSIVAAIEAASGTTPVTIGKPRPVMIQLVQQKFKLQPSEIAFIGDRLDTDIVCARRAGVAAILVLTGVTTLPQARRAKGELRPDSVFPDLTSFVGVVIDNSPAAPLELDELPTRGDEVASATAATPSETAEAAPLFAEDTLAENASIEIVEQESAPDSVEDKDAVSPSAGNPEWEDGWFAEATASSEPNAQENGTASENDEQDSAAAASTSSDGFDWKLD